MPYSIGKSVTVDEFQANKVQVNGTVKATGNLACNDITFRHAEFTRLDHKQAGQDYKHVHEIAYLGSLFILKYFQESNVTSISTTGNSNVVTFILDHDHNVPSGTTFHCNISGTLNTTDLTLNGVPVTEFIGSHACTSTTDNKTFTITTATDSTATNLLPNPSNDLYDSLLVTFHKYKYMDMSQDTSTFTTSYDSALTITHN
jgi:hypothetical protein